ncbi:prolyl endopeptidase [Streptosporangium violaceochromogenes]|nr:prolyl endopeptidase [Streptosporangium violaceochromogenes]
MDEPGVFTLPVARHEGHDVSRYEWLEAQDTPAVAAWAQEQDERCRRRLDALPGSAPFRARLRRLLSVPARWVPQVRQGVMADFRQEAGEERPSLWVTDARGERRIVASASLGDPTEAIAAYSLSPDGTVLAWGTARGGSDWVTVRFRDTRTGVDLPDVLTGIKWLTFGWLGADALAYLAFADPGADEDLLALNTDPRVKIHRFGTPQTDDEVIYKPVGTNWAMPHVSRDGRWLVLQEQIGVVPARVLIRPAGSDEPWQTVVDGAGPIHFVGMIGDEVICHDLREVANGRVIAVDRRDGSERVIVGESATSIDSDFTELGPDWVVTGRHVEHGSEVTVTPLGGGPGRQVPVPAKAVVRDLSVGGDEQAIYLHIERCDSEPGAGIVRHDVETGESRVLHHGALPSRGDVVVETVQVTSADGTQVPMRIIRPAGPAPRGTAKVFLSVYGGYSVPFLTTGYAGWHRAWLDAGGVLAYAGIRGGGEYGEEWHLAAQKIGKQKGIDDLIACAEWFELQGWSGPRQVALNGMSNGGLMVGTVLTQRPDLLGAAIPEVGVFDLLRFHLFTVGHAWVREFGDVNVPRERAALERHSPLHRIVKGTAYPPTLVLTADRDDRVPPGPHSYKFTAALQDAQSGSGEVLMRVAHNAGHAAGRTLAERIDERTAILAFAAAALALPMPADLNTTNNDKEPA